jgi:hypothetical protein
MIYITSGKFLVPLVGTYKSIMSTTEQQLILSLKTLTGNKALRYFRRNRVFWCPRDSDMNGDYEET